MSASTERALDYIARRADDVQRAFDPGAVPTFDDVARDRGSSAATFDPLSVSLPDNAYLLTLDERGRRLYTRDGSLRVTDGTLVCADGSPALGFVAGDDAPAESLSIDPVDRALGRAQHLRIEGDGSLVYDRAAIDPRTGAREMERVTVGRLAIARFPAGTKVRIVDATRGAAPPGVVPFVGRPGDGNFARVVPMRRDGSRIDFDRSLEKLKEAYTAFDAVAAAHKAQGSLGKTTMDLLK